MQHTKISPTRIACLSCSIVVCALNAGCKWSNNTTLQTAIGTNYAGNSVVRAPLGSQPVAGQLLSEITTGPVAPFGSTQSFEGVTAPYLGGSVTLGVWPTYFYSADDVMPANWEIAWDHPPYCVSQTAPYGLLQNPYAYEQELLPVYDSSDGGPTVGLTCFTNSPQNPNIVPTHVIPQFALDDAIPSTLQIATIQPIQAASSITHLHVFGTDLANPANPTAISVASDGSSATFPYPTQSSGASLAAGAYITTITTDPSGAPQTTNGMEPFFVGHDDTSFTGAYGVAVASPQKVVTNTTGSMNPRTPGVCQNSSMNSTTTGGPLPLVTLITQGLLAIGTSSNTVQVGLNPTVVIPFNNQPKVVMIGTIPSCNYTVTSYSGAESALVVNTGGNSVSIVQIGPVQHPSGTVPVGNQPVAAAINSAQTMAYVANYSDGTVSEVNLTTLQQTRTIAVMPNPSSITFDTNGNLWVGGQNAIMAINIGSWSIETSTPVNGTINGMSYDMSTGLLVQTMLQNGSASAPSMVTAAGGDISFSANALVSYSTQSTYDVASGAITTHNFVGDNAAYAQSTVAPYLAFPGQTAFSPPIYSASDGDITATVNGTSFTVYVLTTGQILIQGTLPHPARGVALTSNMVYFTMPDSNSLVSVPIQLP